MMITEFFTQYAYKPYHVYTGIVIFMTLSSFGLPIPEELVLVSTGLIAYMAMNPSEFPPPDIGAQGVDMYTAAVICFFAVICSDILIFTIGKVLGRKLFESNFFKTKVGDERLAKIQGWFHKYSAWACGIFRFTPGLRFPAHLTCGAMKIPMWKFVAVDGFAALLSVPTQVILVAMYGEQILENFKRFKMVLLGAIVLFIIFYLVKKWLARKNITATE